MQAILPPCDQIALGRAGIGIAIASGLCSKGYLLVEGWKIKRGSPPKTGSRGYPFITIKTPRGKLWGMCSLCIFDGLKQFYSLRRYQIRHSKSRYSYAIPLTFLLCLEGHPFPVFL